MAKTYRLVCPACGEVMDGTEVHACTKCGADIPAEGMLQLYRKGSPIGMAAAFGIYANGKPYGHIGNTQNLYIPLPYGTYTMHFTCGMNRRCKDLVITLSPEHPNEYMKVAMKSGFWTNTMIPELSKAEDMPND